MNTANILGFSTQMLYDGVGTPMDFEGSTEFGPFTADDVQRHAIGKGFETWDGRRFRYAKNGAVALTQCLMTQGPVVSAKQVSEVQTAYGAAVGAQDAIRLLVTTGGIAAGEAWTVENALAGGFLVANSISPAVIGDYYMIVKSKMVSETLIDVWLDSPIRNAIGATGTVSLVQSKYNGVIVAPATTLTSQPAGVPLCPVPIGYYAWLQTKGPCPMITDTGDTLVVGSLAGVPATNAVAGAVGVTTATAYAFPVYGRVLQVGAADECSVIDLMIE
jgi:hypothetical protein